MSDKQKYYDLYIELLKIKRNDDALLHAYDIFSEKPNIENYYYDAYLKLKNNYIEYRYYKNK